MNASTKTDTAVAAAAAKLATEIKAVITRETAYRKADGTARDAMRATIAGRFTERASVSADDLVKVYPGTGASVAKSRSNRAGELNAAMRTGELIGTALAGELLATAVAFGSRLRDDWRVIAGDARTLYRANVANGMDVRNAQLDAHKRATADFIAAQAQAALRDEAASAKRVADKADKQAETAASYVARVEAKASESGDKSGVKPATKAAQKAATVAEAARAKADALQAKLPKPAAPEPRTAQKVVQAVAVALGDEALPLAALASMARDLSARFRKAGDVKAADAIGRAVEHIAL